MKIYIWSIIAMMLCLSVHAQEGKLSVKINDELGDSFLGATVELEETHFVSISDTDGKAVFTNIPFGSYMLKVSSIGYKTQEQLIVVDEESLSVVVNLVTVSEELEGVVISASRSSRTIENIPTRIEFVSGEELGEKAMMNAANISMVLRESNGVQIQQTSLSSGNTSIKIQGLDGRYTQLLKDGFPLYGGFSGGLSLMQIPPLDLAQFEIIKGSSSTLYGGGAIAGLVNMVSKRPEEKAVLDVLLTQTHVGGSTANVFYSERHGKLGYTLYGSGNYQKIYDSNDDHFSNIPQIRTISFNPKIFYYPSDDTKFWLGLNGTLDERKGGDLSVVNNNAFGTHQYTEENTSKRANVQAVFEHSYNENRSVSVKQSVSYFDRVLKTPSLTFSGTQTDLFTEASYQLNSENTDWVLGANYYESFFKEDLLSGNRDQSSETIGMFANNIYTITDKVVLESGLRVDYSFDYGAFVLPRVSVMWNKTRDFTMRLGGGLGYKLPDMFSEDAEEIHFEGVEAIDKDLVNAETSYGLNWDLNYKTKISPTIRMSWNQLFYVTGIHDALILETDSLDVSKFVNADGFVLSRGAESNVKFSYKDLKWLLSYAYNNTTLNYLDGNPQKTLTPKHTAGSVFMYENEAWRVGVETYYTGEQKLSTGVKTTDYALFGLLVQKHFSWGSPFVNFENITDVRQSRYTKEVSGTHSDPEFSEIYAPTDGFVFTVGIKFNILSAQEHHHH